MSCFVFLTRVYDPSRLVQSRAWCEVVIAFRLDGRLLPHPLLRRLAFPHGSAVKWVSTCVGLLLDPMALHASVYPSGTSKQLYKLAFCLNHVWKKEL